MISPEQDGEALVVRTATFNDVPAVARIEKASFPDPWSATSFKELVSERHVQFLVGELEGEVVAYAISHFVRDDAELTNIAVDQKVRGGGIAAKILSRSINDLRAKGVVQLWLEVRPTVGSPGTELEFAL